MRNGSRNVLPVAYLACALLLIATIVPTTLKRPPQAPPTSAELDPDAPPDEWAEAILSELSRGRSQTAGHAGPDATMLTPVAGDVPIAVRAPGRACPRSFGNPPRQVPSVYAALCAPALEGGNGGTTWKGVDANELRLAVIHAASTFQTSYEGEVPDKRRDNESSEDITYRVYRTYFDQFFQLYGRRLRVFMLKPAANPPSHRAKAIEADERYRVFGAFADAAPTLLELTNRGIVGVGGYQYTQAWFDARPGLLWSWRTDGDKLMRFVSEYVCKKLAGKPAVHAGDPQYQRSTRKFGVLMADSTVYGSGGWSTLASFLTRLLKDDCNVDASVVRIGADASDDARTAMLRFKADGVTSVIPIAYIGDLVNPALYATANAYFPEWIVTGTWLQDQSVSAKLLDQVQWQHAFGITPQQMQLPFPKADWYAAFKEIEPDLEPNPLVGEYLWYPMLQLLNGIQNAGPFLTPDTFRAGMFKYGYRFGDPVWRVGGGYGPGDYTYGDDIAEIWWDAAAQDPTYYGQARGSYRYVRGGQRYRLGEIPREDTLAFRDGVTTVE